MRRWCASEVTGWLFSGQLLGGVRGGEFWRSSEEASPMGMLYVELVAVLSFRIRECEGEVGTGEGREMWLNARSGLVGGKEAGSSGRPPAVGDG